MLMMKLFSIVLFGLLMLFRSVVVKVYSRMLDIMFGFRNIVGVIIMLVIVLMVLVRFQLSVSIYLMWIFMRWFDCGFCVVVCIVRFSGVQWKNMNSSVSMIRVIVMEFNLCEDMQVLLNGGFVGKGFGNGWIVQLKIQFVRLLKIISRLMKMIIMVRIGVLFIRCMIRCWISMFSMKVLIVVMKNVVQYGILVCSRFQQM